jgi:hypothetical protein
MTTENGRYEWPNGHRKPSKQQAKPPHNPDEQPTCVGIGRDRQTHVAGQQHDHPGELLPATPGFAPFCDLAESGGREVGPLPVSGLKRGVRVKRGFVEFRLFHGEVCNASHGVHGVLASQKRTASMKNEEAAPAPMTTSSKAAEGSVGVRLLAFAAPVWLTTAPT